ncbi:hypothetical protein [Polaribacter pacificus]|uniref:hypothetical protein n=1 Tax=Polaribacter pacificus TaxID=1775173 RepID=UPI001662A982|nr:hypothetical protein [Polaribacter pacificus]
MIHLVWSLINLLILLYFIYLLVGFLRKGKAIFKPQFKVVSVFILVVGIIQVISATSLKSTTNKILITDAYNNVNYSKVEELLLEENLTFDIHMSLNYSIDQNMDVPISSQSELTGFVSGYEWEFKSIATETHNPDENAAFVATGILKWNLLGVTVFRELKTFKGFIN